MAKVNSTRISTIKANFQHADVITEDNLADLIDAIAEAAEAHQHVSTGGDGTGTGDAGPIDQSNITIDVIQRITAPSPVWRLAGASPSEATVGALPVLDFSNAEDNFCFYSLLIPHELKAGTTIHVDIDWCYTGSQDNGTVCWKLDYINVDEGETVDGTTITISKTTTGSHATGKLTHTTLDIGITGAETEDVVGLRLWRDTSEDTLATAARLIQVHFRINVNAFGEAAS